MGLVLVGLMVAGLAWAMTGFGSDGDDDESSDPGLPDPQDEVDIPDPDPIPEDPDLGATVTEESDGTFVVEVGDDERGTLVLINYQDTEDAGIGLVEEFQQRLYLLPEDETFPEGGEGDEVVPDFYGTELADLEEDLGLQLLAVWDLGSVVPTNQEPFFEDNTVDPPVIEANRPIAVYDVTANTDGDELIEIRPEGYVPPPPTYNGAEAVTVTQDAIGSAQTDWLIAIADGIELEGRDGDDRLEANALDVTLRGGDGADQLTVTGDGSVAYGGDGADAITMLADGTAYGGEGNDTIADVVTSITTTLRGNEGDDIITLRGVGSDGFGGEGNDTLNVAQGATGYGDAGDDRVQLENGATGDGGAGDDLFTIWNQFRDDGGTPVATGGDGADTFNALVWNPTGTAEDAYLRITDFDPSEDVLQVGVFQTSSASVSGVTLNEAEDGSYTDVQVAYANDNGLPPGTAIIRLDGVTGLSADQIVIVA